MSTKEEQIALLNDEKSENLEVIALMNTQINDLNQAIINVQNTIDGYNAQIENNNIAIANMNVKNATIDDIILTIDV